MQRASKRYSFGPTYWFIVSKNKQQEQLAPDESPVSSTTSDELQEQVTPQETSQTCAPSNELQELRAMLEQQQRTIVDLTESNAHLKPAHEKTCEPCHWDLPIKSRTPVYFSYTLFVNLVTTTTSFERAQTASSIRPNQGYQISSNNRAGGTGSIQSSHKQRRCRIYDWHTPLQVVQGIRAVISSPTVGLRQRFNGDTKD
jgi:hypothetical protein